MSTFDYAPLQALYDRHVDEAGLVDYAGLQAAREPLDAVMAAFAAARPREFATGADRFAFWINAYNIACIAGVVAAYPARSVRKIRPFFGFFLRTRFDVAGRTLTLNQIEHAILRKHFADARLHFAIVCASVSCPRLTPQAYGPDTLEAQLEAAAREFVGTATKNRIDPEAGLLRLSRIFRWYKADFVRDAGSIRAYVTRFAPAEQAAFVGGNTPIRYLPYDWSLNDQRPVA